MKSKIIALFIGSILTVGSVNAFAATSPIISNTNLKVESGTPSKGDASKTFNVNIKEIKSGAFQNVVTYNLKAGDMLKFENFNVSRDNNTRLVFGINDSRIKDTNGVYVFASSILKQFNGTYILLEDGEYTVMVGNKSQDAYKDFTGKISIIKCKWTDEELKDKRLGIDNQEYGEGIIGRNKISRYDMKNYDKKDSLFGFEYRMLRDKPIPGFADFEKSLLKEDQVYTVGNNMDWVRITVTTKDLKDKTLAPKTSEQYDEITERVKLVMAETFPNQDDVKKTGAMEKAKEALKKEFSITDLTGVKIGFYEPEIIIMPQPK